MSATHESVVGDIIEIEHTDDTTASTISWTLIGRTADTIETSPNVEVADRRHHESFQLDKAATSEAWEVTFSRDVTTTTAGMEALGLIDSSNGEVKGHHDTRTSSATNEALQVTVYENEADRASGTAKVQYGYDEYILTLDSHEINVDDFSTMELVIHSLSRPKRLDVGGTLDGSA